MTTGRRIRELGSEKDIVECLRSCARELNRLLDAFENMELPPRQEGGGTLAVAFNQLIDSLEELKRRI